MIEVKLIMGDSHGMVVSVDRFVQVIEMPMKPSVATFTGVGEGHVHLYRSTERYVIHQLPGGRLIGLLTGYTLAMWLDGVLATI